MKIVSYYGKKWLGYPSSPSQELFDMDLYLLKSNKIYYEIKEKSDKIEVLVNTNDYQKADFCLNG